MTNAEQAAKEELEQFGRIYRDSVNEDDPDRAVDFRASLESQIDVQEIVREGQSVSYALQIVHDYGNINITAPLNKEGFISGDVESVSITSDDRYEFVLDPRENYDVIEYCQESAFILIDEGR